MYFYPFPPTTQPFSSYPPCFMDVSFWIPDAYESNDFYDLVRSVAGDLVENVSLFDDFTHPKTGRTSHAYRITYRSMDRVLTMEEINVVQDRVREEVGIQLGVEIR